MNDCPLRNLSLKKIERVEANAFCMDINLQLKESLFTQLIEMSKTVTPLTAQLVQFDTSVPFAEVISRLDEAVNKTQSGDIIARFRSGKTQQELASVVEHVTQEKDFL